MSRITTFVQPDGSVLKQCSLCRELKSISNFNKNRNTVQSHCKPCRNTYRAERRKLLPDRHREIDRARNLKRYGLTVAEWDNLFNAQGHCCAICKTETPTGAGWHTDHEHSTGEVRGILCHNCNVSLGYYENYIRGNEDRFKKYLDGTLWLGG